MTRYGTLLVCLAASFTGAALAQTDEAKPAKTSPPVAYVYVSRPTHIDGFAVSSKGELTPVPGSPFLGKVQSMAVSSSLLFGSGADMTNVYSFHVAPDGALKPAETTNVQTHNSSDCGGLGPPLLDHSGDSLYVGAAIQPTTLPSCFSQLVTKPTSLTVHRNWRRIPPTTTAT